MSWLKGLWSSYNHWNWNISSGTSTSTTFENKKSISKSTLELDNFDATQANIPSLACQDNSIKDITSPLSKEECLSTESVDGQPCSNLDTLTISNSDAGPIEHLKKPNNSTMKDENLKYIQEERKRVDRLNRQVRDEKRIRPRIVSNHQPHNDILSPPKPNQTRMNVDSNQTHRYPYQSNMDSTFCKKNPSRIHQEYDSSQLSYDRYHTMALKNQTSSHHPSHGPSPKSIECNVNQMDPSSPWRETCSSSSNLYHLDPPNNTPDWKIVNKSPIRPLTQLLDSLEEEFSSNRWKLEPRSFVEPSHLHYQIDSMWLPDREKWRRNGKDHDDGWKQSNLYQTHLKFSPFSKSHPLPPLPTSSSVQPISSSIRQSFPSLISPSLPCSQPISPTVYYSINRLYVTNPVVTKGHCRKSISSKLSNRIKHAHHQRQVLQRKKKLYKLKGFGTIKTTKRKSDDLSSTIVKNGYDRNHVDLNSAVEIYRPVSDPNSQDLLKSFQLIQSAYEDQPLVQRLNSVLRTGDLNLLVHNDWLNDELINFWSAMLQERSDHVHQGSSAIHWPKCYHFNSFFYEMLSRRGYQSVERWTKKVDLFEFDKVMIPVHLPNHWCLAIINFQKKQLEYYDPLGGNNQSCISTLRKYIQEEWRNKKMNETGSTVTATTVNPSSALDHQRLKTPPPNSEEYDLNDWKDWAPKDKPHQENGYDCGVFVCMYMEYCARNARFDFRQSDMANIRKHILISMLANKTLPNHSIFE